MAPRNRSLLAGTVPLALLLACGGTGSDPTPNPPAQGLLDVVLTDAPSDGWQAVEVVVQAITLVDKVDASREVLVFQGNGTKVNLVELDEIGELLARAEVPEGTYGRLKIRIDTAPGSIHLVRADGTHVPTDRIKVAGDSATITLTPDLVVSPGSTAAVQVDFDLAHPLFLIETPTGDVVLNLQAFHRPNLGHFGWGHFRPAAGQVAVVSPGNRTFTLANRYGKRFDVAWDAQTAFFNANQRPIVPGSADGLAKDAYVLIQLNRTAAGGWLARRVWYTADPAVLASLKSPEGHLLAVDPGAGTLRISQADGTPKTVFVDPDTAILFRDGSTVGIGPSALADLLPGFKVHAELKDPQAAEAHAARILVQRAVDGGVVGAATPTGFTFQASDWKAERAYAYASGFAWWPLANPAAASFSIPDFQAAATSSQGIQAEAVSGLAWSTSGWQASTAILTPVPLPRALGADAAAITAPYDPATRQLALTAQVAGSEVTKTLTLSDNPSDQVQTVVWKVVRDASTVTTAFVPPSAWPMELAASARAVRATVVPAPGGALKACTVVVFWDNRP